jgi:hypothetical protein
LLAPLWLAPLQLAPLWLDFLKVVPFLNRIHPVYLYLLLHLYLLDLQLPHPLYQPARSMLARQKLVLLPSFVEQHVNKLSDNAKRLLED